MQNCCVGESLGTTKCLKSVVVGNHGHAPCKIFSLQHSLFLCQSNLVKIIRSSYSWGETCHPHFGVITRYETVVSVCLYTVVIISIFHSMTLCTSLNGVYVFLTVLQCSCQRFDFCVFGTDGASGRTVPCSRLHNYGYGTSGWGIHKDPTGLWCSQHWVCWEVCADCCDVVVELPQTPDNDIMSARAASGRRRSWCRWSWQLCVWWGQGCRLWMVYMCEKARGLVACWEMQEHFLSARLYADDPRSHCLLGAQFWVGFSRNYSIFIRRL